MKIKNIFLIILAVASTLSLADNQKQTIEVINNTNQSHVLQISQPIPAYTRAVITSTLTKLNTPQDMLFAAILNDSASEVRQAILCVADVNIGRDGKAPILWAVLLKKGQAVEELVKCGANLNVMHSGQHLIHLADIQTVVLFIKNGANLGLNTGIGMMERAILGNQIELIQLLIDRGWNIHDNTINDRKSPTSSVWQRAMGSEEIVKLFIKNGVNPSQLIHNASLIGQTLTPLHIAICCSNKNMVKVLLEAGADINQKASPEPQSGMETPLSFAIRKGAMEIAELLLSNGAKL